MVTRGKYHLDANPEDRRTFLLVFLSLLNGKPYLSSLGIRRNRDRRLPQPTGKECEPAFASSSSSSSSVKVFVPLPRPRYFDSYSYLSSAIWLLLLALSDKGFGDSAQSSQQTWKGNRRWGRVSQWHQLQTGNRSWIFISSLGNTFPTSSACLKIYALLLHWFWLSQSSVDQSAGFSVLPFREHFPSVRVTLGEDQETPSTPIKCRTSQNMLLENTTQRPTSRSDLEVDNSTLSIASNYLGKRVFWKFMILVPLLHNYRRTIRCIPVGRFEWSPLMDLTWRIQSTQT